MQTVWENLIYIYGYISIKSIEFIFMGILVYNQFNNKVQNKANLL